MNSKQQGDLGVAAAIFHYTKQGHTVCAPLTDNARYDLVVDKDGLKRVQVKTTRYITSYGIYQVCFRTSGGNKSGTGKVKLISEDECDLVYVYCMDGSTYEFPSRVAVGHNMINLGNKYEQYKL